MSHVVISDQGVLPLEVLGVRGPALHRVHCRHVGLEELVDVHHRLLNAVLGGLLV